jgi:hypothetical protein
MEMNKQIWQAEALKQAIAVLERMEADYFYANGGYVESDTNAPVISDDGCEAIWQTYVECREVLEEQVKAIQTKPAEVAHPQLVLDLAMLVRRLAYFVGKYAPAGMKCKGQAIEFLTTHGLQGSVLREEYTEGAAQPQEAGQEGTERKDFEQWYTTHTFDYEKNPIGSRECGLQWASWLARAQSPAEGGDRRERIIDDWLKWLAPGIAQSICETPDRDSPEDRPDMCLVTPEEIINTVEGKIETLRELLAASPPTTHGTASSEWRAALAEAQRDAGRYRWLRQDRNIPAEPTPTVPWITQHVNDAMGRHNIPLTNKLADAAIDQAMQEQGE